MSTEGGTRALIAALSANLAIAVSKFAAFAFTGSSSMLAEECTRSPTPATRYCC